MRGILRSHHRGESIEIEGVGDFPGCPGVKTVLPGDTGSIPGGRTKSPHAVWLRQKLKKKERRKQRGWGSAGDEAQGTVV